MRLRQARDEVARELGTLQRELPIEAPAELSALLDVHLMLLHDDTLTGATKQWILDRRYNAEWALSAQLEVLARQFDEMEDEYLRVSARPTSSRSSSGSSARCRAERKAELRRSRMS